MIEKQRERERIREKKREKENYERRKRVKKDLSVAWEISGYTENKRTFLRDENFNGENISVLVWCS